MALDTNILTSIHGRRFGISANGEMVANNLVDNTQVVRGSRKFTVSAAQVLALNATPIAVLPARAGLIAMVERWGVYKAAGTAYAGIAAGEDLALKYTNGAGNVAATPIETTGFLDQTTAQTRWANGTATGDGATPTTSPITQANANSALVLQILTGEITTGNSPLIVVVHYVLVPSIF